MSNLYDAIIVGGGPAGLSAAIYLARAKFSVLVIEKEKIGGQITITSEVVNYPGILQTSGQELTEYISIRWCWLYWKPYCISINRKWKRGSYR